MQHGERERELMIQLSAALRETERLQEALGDAFEDRRAADKRADAAESALAAARRALTDQRRSDIAVLRSFGYIDAADNLQFLADQEVLAAPAAASPAAAPAAETVLPPLRTAKEAMDDGAEIDSQRVAIVDGRDPSVPPSEPVSPERPVILRRYEPEAGGGNVTPCRHCRRFFHQHMRDNRDVGWCAQSITEPVAPAPVGCCGTLLHGHAPHPERNGCIDWMPLPVAQQPVAPSLLPRVLAALEHVADAFEAKHIRSLAAELRRYIAEHDDLLRECEAALKEAEASIDEAFATAPTSRIRSCLAKLQARTAARSEGET